MFYRWRYTMREAPEALWYRRKDARHEASISMTSTRPRGWRTSKPGQSPSPEKRVQAPPPARHAEGKPRRRISGG